MFTIGISCLAFVMTVITVRQFRGLLAELRACRELGERFDREDKLRRDEEKQAGR